ncbi:MAG: mechanosensitive ion channel [Kiloniellales bacterium]|nr:mechanosensitive ion channel [Kiloniellales bacterium]
MEDTVKEIQGLIVTYGLSALGAFLVLVIGWILSGWLSGLVGRVLGKTAAVDETLRGFLVSLVKYLILIFTVVATLNQFGVQTTSIIAVLGAASLAIGLAMQGTLSNVAAGVMLLLIRPFKVGDYVEAGGFAGTVKVIHLFLTELATPDNVQILVPNAQIWGSAIQNYSFHKTRRLDLVVGVSYEDDLTKAVAVLEDAVKADSRVQADPVPQILVGELADNSVNITIRLWCNAADLWPLKFDLTKALKLRLDQEGISIPYPQRTVHVVTGEAAALG